MTSTLIMMTTMIMTIMMTMRMIMTETETETETERETEGMIVKSINLRRMPLLQSTEIIKTAAMTIMRRK